MTNQENLALGNSGASKMEVTAKKVERISATLPNVEIKDLRAALYILQLLEPKTDRAVLIENIRCMIKTCCDLERFVDMYQLLLERSHHSRHSRNKVIAHDR